MEKEIRRAQYPPREWLRDRLLEELTHDEIADLWEQESGYRLSKSYVSVYVSRHFSDLPLRRPRYEYDLPWHVKVEHNKHPFARLLRLLARRRDGEKINETLTKWLDNWLREMRDADCVVDYVPGAYDPAEAFIPVSRQPGDREMTSIRHTPVETLSAEERSELGREAS